MNDIDAIDCHTHNKDVIVLEPHPHHTLQATFEEGTAETKEEMDNTHMWCEVYGHCLVSLEWS